MAKCHIIGILDSGLPSLATPVREVLTGASLLIGVQRTLDLVASEIPASVQMRSMDGVLGKVADWCQESLQKHKDVVVLATGDPLCHGIAPLLIQKLGSKDIEIHPNLSTIQLAAARAGVAWQGFMICSIHSHDAGAWQIGASPEHRLYPLMQHIRRGKALAILTSPANGPERIAEMMLMEKCSDGWQMVVAEHLQQEDEAVIGPLSIEDIPGRQFASPNVVLLWHQGKFVQKPRFGIADNNFSQRRPERGLITKREVRAVSLAAMQLKSDATVWDIGAGSGAVGLEAARLCPDGHVFAFEKNRSDLTLIEENRQMLQISNYTLLHAKAPDRLAELPDPDAVFIGGSGGQLKELIDLVLGRLKPDGWLVINLVTLENLNSATECLKRLNCHWELSLVSVARSSPILNMQRLSAENPVWVISASPLIEESS